MCRFPLSISFDIIYRFALSNCTLSDRNIPQPANTSPIRWPSRDSIDQTPFMANTRRIERYCHHSVNVNMNFYARWYGGHSLHSHTAREHVGVTGIATHTGYWTHREDVEYHAGKF
jgi:hypothetical protein